MTEEEKQRFILEEREIQKQLDAFYRRQGHIIARNGDKHHDLILDNTIVIEEKIRSEKRNDILIEICQDIVSGSPGWFSIIKVDKLNYVMCELGTAVLLYEINWPEFKRWFIETYIPTHLIGKYVASVRGWGITINIAVPISQIPSDLIQEYDVMQARMNL